MNPQLGVIVFVIQPYFKCSLVLLYIAAYYKIQYKESNPRIISTICFTQRKDSEIINCKMKVCYEPNGIAAKS